MGISSFWRKTKQGYIKATRNAFNRPLTEFDSGKAQNIYRNAEKRFFLSGGSVKSIIDFSVGFVGTPYITDTNGATDECMDEFNNNKSKLMMIVRDSGIEGTIYLRFDYAHASPYSDKPEITVDIIENIRVLPLIDNRGITIGYRIDSDIPYSSVDRTKTYRMREEIYKDKILITREGAPHPLLKQEEIVNPFGVLTVIPIVNEQDKYGMGYSDIEPITPYLSLYNNIMEQANQYLYLHSEPKIKLKISDYNTFMALNSGLLDRDGNLDIGGGAVFYIKETDDAAYITAPSAMSDFEKLLNYTFYNIIQASQTPEFLMGNAISSSKASAESQMIIIDVKTSRKRTLYHDQFITLYKIFAKIYSRVNMTEVNVNSIQLLWDNVQASAEDVSGVQEEELDNQEAV